MEYSAPDYTDCLRVFKESLKGGSEFKQLIEGITKNLSTNKIRWFEVGIGNGHYLKKIVDELEKRGFEVEVSGIDICESSIKEAREIFPKGKIICGDFSNQEINEKYDVFSFNQAIYYFYNKNYIVEKCLSHLSEGGLLINVCWSKKDKLFQFHQKVFGKWTLGAFNSEEFKKLISRYKNIKVVTNFNFKGIIDFSLWKDDANLDKNLYVISRIPIANKIPEVSYTLAKKLIHKQKDKEERVNGILIVKKSYQIQEFSNQKIYQNLKLKFPDYIKDVDKIEGDLEALFMGSWQRETEYLSDYIPSGRILEICCGVGLRSIIFAKKHKVIAIDINKKRLNCANKNARLFGVEKNVLLKRIDANRTEDIKKLGKFDAIYIDVDWRENLKDPIKKQNIIPFKTCPRTDKLYKNIRSIYPYTPIIFKVSPFSRVKEFNKLGPCIIEALYINDKFLSYNVYFDPKIKFPRFQEIHLFNKLEN